MVQSLFLINRKSEISHRTSVKRVNITDTKVFVLDLKLPMINSIISSKIYENNCMYYFCLLDVALLKPL